MLKNKFNLSELSKLFGLPNPDDVDVDCSDTFVYARKEALENGATEDEANEAGITAEEQEMDEYFNKMFNSIEETAETFFGYHGLTLVKNSGKNTGTFTLKPVKSWEHAANEIRNTVNGIGYFYFASLKEFLDSGPWTARQAVLGHLGSIKRYGDVCGGGSPQSVYYSNVL
jgi:hypothetical protein